MSANAPILKEGKSNHRVFVAKDGDKVIAFIFVIKQLQKEGYSRLGVDFVSYGGI